MEEKDFSFGMSEEQRTMKETIARLVKGLVTDNAHDMDEKKAIPAEFIQKVWELGATISAIPEEFGGYGMEYSPIMNAIILEELAAGDMALAIAATLPSLFLYPILEMGTDEQKKKYITALLRRVVQAVHGGDQRAAVQIRPGDAGDESREERRHRTSSTGKNASCRWQKTRGTCSSPPTSTGRASSSSSRTAIPA